MPNPLTKQIGLSVGLLALTGGYFQAKAGDVPAKTPVLLELFTSEGCSSCPPADKLLEALDEQQPFVGVDLVVLSEHVDYWNDGGWTDPYSSRALTERQTRYASQFGKDPYTPEVVIDGAKEAVGSNIAAIRNAVDAAAHIEKVPLTFSSEIVNQNRIKVHLSLGNLEQKDGAAAVYVAIADNKDRSNVGAGENRGQSLSHVAVVRVLSRVGAVKPGHQFERDVTIPMPSPASASGIRVVVFLQSEHSHRILAAAERKI